MSRGPAILLRLVGLTSTGRGLYRLVHRDGRLVGRRFCLTHAIGALRATRRRR